MKTVIADFEKRVGEIDAYFKHLEAIEERDGKLSLITAGARVLRDIEPELVKVLKANLFLLLYNLVESSVRQAITELLDAVSSEGMTYAEASDHIKKLWIREGHKRFENQSSEQIFQALANLADDIIEMKLKSGAMAGGNIDSRKIREFSHRYGFSCKVHRNAKDGVKLFDVKKRRNDLAHGLVSFSECGRNYTLSDLRQTKHEVVMYVRGILRNVCRYIDRKRFRA